MAIALDPTTDPVTQGYVADGNTSFLQLDLGGRLTINDTSSREHLFYTRTEAEIPTREVRVRCLLQATPVSLDSEDIGVRVVLDEGTGNQRLELACLFTSGQRRLGFLLASGTFSTGVQFDWSTESTFELHRTAGGDAVVEVEGVGGEQIPNSDLPAGLRPQPAFEFGCFSDVQRTSARFGPIEEVPAGPVIHPMEVRLTQVQIRVDPRGSLG